MKVKPMHEGLKCPFRDISECHLTILAFLDRTFQGIPKMLRAGGQQLLMDGILMHIGAEFDLNDRGAYVAGVELVSYRNFQRDNMGDLYVNME